MDIDSEEFWTDYYETVKDRPPRPTLLEALSYFDKDPKQLKKVAIDLGAGVGNDTRELISRGWEVYAFDATSSAMKYIRTGLSQENLELLKTMVTRFENIILPKGVSLINASYSIPFCSPAEFPALWEKITTSLASGGRFCGHIFGNEDEWASSETMTFFTRHAAEQLFEGFELEKFWEENQIGKVASGASKHWHLFHIVARKK